MLSGQPDGGCFEDFAVGDVIESPESYEITLDNLHAFAAEFDPQPMHTDDEAARDGPFGELVASGWQTLSVTMRLMVRSPLFASGEVVGVGVDKIKWLRPVRPGDRLRVRAQIIGKRESASRPEQGLLFVSVLTYAEGRPDEPVVSEDVTMMVPRHPQGADE